MKHLVFAAAILTVSACATVRPNNFIDTEARSSLSSIETILIVKNSEIGTEINVSNVAAVTGGGLIPALVDAGINSDRTKRAEVAAGPIRDKLIDFDFAAELEADLERELAEIEIDGISEIELVRAELKDYRAGKVSGATAPAVMFIDSNYKLSPTMAHIVLAASVQIFPTLAELNAYKEKIDEDSKFEPSDNIFRNVYRSEVNLVEVTDGVELGALAAEMPIEDLVKAISIASDKLAKMIAADLIIDDTYEK